MSPPNAIIGFDLAGTVVAVGNDIANSNLKLGDRVATMVHGGAIADRGAFAGKSCILPVDSLPIRLLSVTEYARADSDLVWLVPDSVSLREAAGVTATLATAAQSLFHILDLPYPVQSSADPSDASAQSNWILIYGGSSSVGLFAIQLAKFAGLKVVTVCSPKNFELVKQHGADAVVDYRDSQVAIQAIRKATSSSLTVAFDCIGEGDSPIICIEAMTGEGERRIVSVTPPSDTATQLAAKSRVKLNRVMAFTLFGLVSGELFNRVWLLITFMQPVPLGPDITAPANPRDRAFFVKLNQHIPVLFGNFGLKVNPITDMEGGLDGIPAGFELMKDGKVSASKLVYKVADV